MVCYGGLDLSSKLDLAAALVREVLVFFKPERICVLFDSWYCNQTLVGSLPEGVVWVSRLKRNRIIYVGGRRKSLGSFARGVKPWEYRKASVGGKTYWCHELTVWIQKLGTVKIVLTKGARNSETVDAILVSNQLEATATGIITDYSQRWSIEVCIRNLKQTLGFEGCTVRSKKALRRYWTLLMLSSWLLSCLRMKWSRCCHTAGEVAGRLKKFHEGLRERIFPAIRIHVGESFAKG